MYKVVEACDNLKTRGLTQEHPTEHYKIVIKYKNSLGIPADDPFVAENGALPYNKAYRRKYTPYFSVAAVVVCASLAVDHFLNRRPDLI